MTWSIHACGARSRSPSARRSACLSIALSKARCSGDRELMEYALYNLLTNAVKYSPADTEIHVYSRAARRRIAACRCGPGNRHGCQGNQEYFPEILPDQARRSFGRSRHRIGLSIVEQIVTHHGGRMEVTSEPGKGSCFTMIMKA